MQPIKQTLVTFALFVVAATWPHAAQAGEYNVHSCALPDGRPAATDGWSSGEEIGGGSGYINTCAGPGGSIAAVIRSDVAHPSNQGLTWHFTAPAPILRYRLWRRAVLTPHAPSEGAATPYFWTSQKLRSNNAAYVLDNCAAVFGCTQVGAAAGRISANLLAPPALPTDTRDFYARLECGGIGICESRGGNSLGWFNIWAAVFTLADDDAPNAAAVNGSLTAPGDHAGTDSISLTATDSGSGIYRYAVLIDGGVVLAATPNEFGGRCVDRDQANAAGDFEHLRPCPTTQPIAADLDTASLSDGAHSLTVRLYDAAGNVTTAFANHRFLVHNQTATVAPLGAPNGAGGDLASARFEMTNATVRTRYGLARELAARLVDAAGRPIGGATIDVLERVRVAGAQRRRVAETQTDAAGRLAYAPKPTSSKTVTFAYARTQVSTDYSATADARLLVRGSISLRAKRRALAPHGTLRLRGRVKAADLRRGVAVEIQASDGRGWRTVAIRRATRNGRFAFSHHFKRTAHGRFRFRARVRRSSDLSVEPARSRPLKVRVG